MRVFISSKMVDVLERKAAVDAVHAAGHIPLFIEAEELIEENKDRIEELMVGMIERADVFIGVYLDKIGGDDEKPDETAPIIFELDEFIKKSKNDGLMPKGQRRIFQYIKEKSNPELHEAVSRKNLPSKEEFKKYDELSATIFNTFNKLKKPMNPIGNESKRLSLNVEFAGADTISLMGCISEFLYTKHLLNIDYVVGSSLNERAVLRISASQREEATAIPSAELVETSLEKELRKKLEIQIGGESENQIFAKRYTVKGGQYGRVIIRCIDSPGQLNAVCKVVKDLNLNITQLHLSEAPPEFKRQTLMDITVYLNKQVNKDESRRGAFLQFEARLRNLVGVRSIDTRYLNSNPNSAGTQ